MLIFDWEKNRVCGIEAGSRGKGLASAKGFGWTWPESLTPSQNAAGAGEFLKAELQKRDIRPQPAILCLPREDTIVRHLELPPVPDDELPDLVRLQTATRSSVPLEQLVLDFLPLPGGPDRATRDVLVVTAPLALVQAARATLEKAGCELAKVTLNAIGQGECLAQAGHTAASVLVVVDEPRIEMAVLQEGQLLFSHAARLSQLGQEPVGWQPLGAEVSRSLIAAQRISPTFQAIQCDLLMPPGHPERENVRRLLSERLGLPVEDLLARSPDLAGLLGQPDSGGVWLAGPAGVAAALEHPKLEGLDLINPRKPVVKKDDRKAKWAAIGAGVLLLAALGVFYRSAVLADLTAQLETLQKKDQQLGDFIRRSAADQKVYGAVAEWDRHRPEPSREVSQLYSQLGSTQPQYLTSLSLSTTTGDSRGRVQASGQARDRSVVQDLNQRLVDSRLYRIRPQTTEAGGKDADYPVKFGLDADLLAPPPPSKPAAPAKPVTPIK